MKTRWNRRRSSPRLAQRPDVVCATLMPARNAGKKRRHERQNKRRHAAIHNISPQKRIVVERLADSLISPCEASLRSGVIMAAYAVKIESDDPVTLHRVMQRLIGDGLKDRYEAPQSLSHELFVLMLQIKEQERRDKVSRPPPQAW